MKALAERIDRVARMVALLAQFHAAKNEFERERARMWIRREIEQHWGK